MIIGLLQNLYKFLCTQLCENMLQATILFVTTIALIIAIKTYQADVKQKRLKNTIEYIHLFLEGNWISQQDKKYWNEFWQKLDRNACGDFSLTGKFIAKGDGYENEYNALDIIEVFSEGQYQHYGKTISNVLNIMEYVADKVLCGDLDIACRLGILAQQ